MSHGLPPEHDDPPVRQGHAAAAPATASRGRVVHVTARGLAPEADEGPVDLTIYRPDPDGWRLPSRPDDPHRYAVAVEATLDVRDGRAAYAFRTVGEDAAGRHVAVFRRTDVSSRPAAVVAFTLR